jgi:hypothetical protein
MRLLLAIPTVALLCASSSDDLARVPWGADGHEMAARAATSVLPTEVPTFFRSSGDQLVYLNPEPDRWRERSLVAMDQGWNYDHYIDLENVPDAALLEPDRFTYLEALYAAGVEEPHQAGGFLPYRILEMYQRLVTEWRLWRAERDPERRGWIEQRIVNDAGILGHYVTDASQPHHTTIHFNGWAAGAPNPEGFTQDRSFHARFESGFVAAWVSQADVSRRADDAPRSLVGNVRPTIIEYIRESNEQVDDLYRLDRDVGFDPSRTPAPAARDFAAERLAVGARMLADLWWSAWLESASPPARS